MGYFKGKPYLAHLEEEKDKHTVILVFDETKIKVKAKWHYLISSNL